MGSEKGIYPMGKLITHKYKLGDINQAFEENLKMAPVHIKGVVMLFSA